MDHEIFLVIDNMNTVYQAITLRIKDHELIINEGLNQQRVAFIDVVCIKPTTLQEVVDVLLNNIK